MIQWTEDKIKWYENAIHWNQFDKQLSRQILPYLKRGESVIELGAGTGFLSRELCRQGMQILAIEQNHAAASYMVKRAEKEQLTSLIICEGDWAEILPGQVCDTLVMVYAGDFRKELDLYLSCARRQIFLITREPVQEGGRYRLSEREMRELLDARGLRYEITMDRLPLHQPFSTLKECEAYLEAYAYTEEDKQIYRRMLIPLSGEKDEHDNSPERQKPHTYKFVHGNEKIIKKYRIEQGDEEWRNRR